MTTGAELLALMSVYGLWILAPLALLEGPIVTVIAAWLASLGILDIRAVIVCVILADVAGDALMYLVGRRALGLIPRTWRDWLGLTRPRLARLIRRFRKDGWRILVAGKLTHAAGFAVLITAGAARMPFLQFLLVNTLATIPKSLAFVALGYLVGSAHQRVADGLFWFSLAMVVAGAVAVLWWWRRRNRGREEA